jgi:FAD/FMN-containing dehydrogenase
LTSGRLRPPSFDGDFLDDAASIDAWAGASGPFYLPPRAVALPSDASAVATLVRWAVATNTALVPRGAGSGMPGGNVGPHVVLDLSRLDRIDVGDDRVVAGAGAVAADVRAAVRAAGRDLPALPSSAPWCTVGGIVANDAAGARSFRWGSAHAWVDRLDVVGVDGELRTLRRGDVADAEVFALHAHLLSTLPVPLTWPQVRKNASGYALDRFLETGDPLDLWVGSEGTLGVVVAAELRSFPRPAARGVALIGPGDRACLPEVVGLAGSVDADACEWFGERLLDLGELADDPRLAGLDLGAGVCLVEVTGTETEVSDRLDRIAASAPPGGCRTTTDADTIEAFWGIRHDASPSIEARAGADRRSTQFIEDCVVPVAALPAWLDRLDAALDEHRIEAVVFGHLGDGNLHVNPLLDLSDPGWREAARGLMEGVVDIVSDLGGTLSGEHGDGRLRGAYHTRIWGGAITRAFAVVKRAFDPAGVFNPGVIVPLDGQDPFDGFGAAPDFARGSRGPARRRTRQLVAEGETA